MSKDNQGYFDGNGNWVEPNNEPSRDQIKHTTSHGSQQEQFEDALNAGLKGSGLSPSQQQEVRKEVHKAANESRRSGQPMKFDEIKKTTEQAAADKKKK
jgi:hypothetical protein